MIVAPTIQLRPIAESDTEFLCRVYASTRHEELLSVPWTDSEKAEFLRFQFEAQHSHYQKHYANAEFSVIEIDGRPAGRLYLQRLDDEIRLVDISLLPEFRGAGIGGELLRTTLRQASDRGAVVRIHVEHNNPAMRLYERLGFVRVEERGVYWLLQWTPQTNRNHAPLFVAREQQA